jgi:hypothetical protein
VFVGGAVTFAAGAAPFIGEGSLAVGRSFKTAVTFVGRGSSAIGGRSLVGSSVGSSAGSSVGSSVGYLAGSFSCRSSNSIFATSIL